MNIGTIRLAKDRKHYYLDTTRYLQAIGITHLGGTQYIVSERAYALLCRFHTFTEVDNNEPKRRRNNDSVISHYDNVHISSVHNDKG